MRIKSKLLTLASKALYLSLTASWPFSLTNSVSAIRPSVSSRNTSSLQPQDLVCFYSTPFAVWKAYSSGLSLSGGPSPHLPRPSRQEQVPSAASSSIPAHYSVQSTCISQLCLRHKLPLNSMASKQTPAGWPGFNRKAGLSWTAVLLLGGL